MVSLMPISPRRSLALSCCLTLALAPVVAQDLQLDVVGGSLPGSLSMDAYPGLYPFEFTAIVPSFQVGPLPLALFDPVDTRSLDIGGDLLSAAWLGFSGLDGHLRIGPLAFPAVPGMQDVAIYFQAITVGNGSPIVDRISNGNQIRLANAGAFRDRSGVRHSKVGLKIGSRAVGFVPSGDDYERIGNRQERAAAVAGGFGDEGVGNPGNGR